MLTGAQESDDNMAISGRWRTVVVGVLSKYHNNGLPSTDNKHQTATAPSGDSHSTQNSWSYNNGF